jgi:hypothetical protein
MKGGFGQREGLIMVEEQARIQQERIEQLRHLAKTDPDPRVRRQCLLLVSHCSRQARMLQ